MTTPADTGVPSGSTGSPLKRGNQEPVPVPGTGSRAGTTSQERTGGKANTLARVVNGSTRSLPGISGRDGVDLGQAGHWRLGVRRQLVCSLMRLAVQVPSAAQVHRLATMTPCERRASREICVRRSHAAPGSRVVQHRHSLGARVIRAARGGRRG